MLQIRAAVQVEHNPVALELHRGNDNAVARSLRPGPWYRSTACIPRASGDSGPFACSVTAGADGKRQLREALLVFQIAYQIPASALGQFVRGKRHVLSE